MDRRVIGLVCMSWVVCVGCVATSEDDPSEDESVSSAESGEGPGSTTEDPTSEGGTIDAEACDAAADAAPSHFALDVGEWEIDDEFFAGTLQGSCTVLAVDVSSDVIATELECMDGDAGPYAVALTVAAAAGTPAWAADDEVDLLAVVSDSQGGLTDDEAPVGRTFLHAGASLRRASDGALLVVGASGSIDIEDLFAPLDIELMGACASVEPCSSDADAALQYALSEQNGEAILLTGGQHGELALADGTTLVIDAPRAHSTSDCHFGSDYALAARRME
jgi:hypothetical protein